MDKKKRYREQFAEVKAQLISCKNPNQSKKLINKLLSIHQALLHEPVELTIPCKEVKDSIDLGVTKVSRTIRGYLFEAKGGLYTFVEHRMARVCAMFNTLFELHNKERSEEEDSLYELFKTAFEVIMQAPLFASIDEGQMFEVASKILDSYTVFGKEFYEDADAVEETEEDIRENIEAEQLNAAIEHIASIPLPPEEEIEDESV